MINRYINSEIDSIWNDQNKFNTWKLVQEKYLETLEELNIADKGVAKKIKETEVLKEEVYKREEVTNHDLASFVDILQEKVGEGSNWIHYGLTSSDIVDTANSILIMQSIDTVIELMNNLLSTLQNRAIEEKDTLIIGRTHGVYAEETFLGNIFGNWYLEVSRNLKRIQNSKENIAFGKFSGPVGNHSVVTEEMEKLSLKKLGLVPEIFANQIVARDRYAEVVSSLGILASTFERIATNIRSYQRSEISEMFEAFKEGQKGSSAMPHKKNPIGSERVTGLSRIMRSYVNTSLENMVLWNERDISNSSVERIILPDAFHLISFMTSELNMIISNLVVNHDKIEKNLQNAKNKSMSQKFLSHLVNSGIDRDTAYRKIQDQIFKNTPLNELKENLQIEFNVKFPDFNDDVQKNVDQNKFKDKFQ
ncbi:MAG: adenylosuccinate lyase [Candidatus Actinomarina sp.]|tara:strand:+ start:2086 stop:3348 length:1263 start_codon:yes stop_codon:yes gene_type:complete